MSEPQMAPMIFIKKFWTTYEPDPQKPGQLREVDWVAYGPVGSAQLLLNTEKVSRLSAVIPLEGRAAVNPAVQMAHMRWNAIKPRYDAWKAGRAAPVDGTPLGAWPGISQEQGELLRMNGVHTVEDVSKLTDTHKNRLGIPGLGDMIENAKRFLAAQDKNVVAKALEQKDQQIAELKAQQAEMAAMIQELMATKQAAVEPQKRRGRPPKQPAESEAA